MLYVMFWDGKIRVIGRFTFFGDAVNFMHTFLARIFWRKIMKKIRANTIHAIDVIHLSHNTHLFIHLYDYRRKILNQLLI